MDRFEQPFTGELERDSRPARVPPTGIDADVEHEAKLDLIERLLNARGERKNVFRIRLGHHHHDDAGPQASDVLLELQVTIGGDQRVEPGTFGAAQQFTVACAAPPHLRHGAGIVAGQSLAESPGSDSSMRTSTRLQQCPTGYLKSCQGLRTIDGGEMLRNSSSE